MLSTDLRERILKVEEMETSTLLNMCTASVMTVKSTVAIRRSPPDHYGTQNSPHAVGTNVTLLAPKMRQ